VVVVELFELHAGEASPTPSPSSLDRELLGELLRAACETWPDVELAPEVFAQYLRSRVPAGVDSEQALRSMRTSDLYLACACARGDSRAIAAFELRCLSVIEETLPRMAGMASDIVDEVKQQLRRRLLVADPGPPTILEFSGRGELRRWIRVLAVREALAITRRTRRESPADVQVLERALRPAGDPEREYLKRFYQSAFASCLADALPRLSLRDQTLLRESFVDCLNIDQIGARHRVHRATAARWLARAQRELSKETQALLMHRLHARPAEMRSILFFLRSGLHISLRLLFSSRNRAGRRPLLATEQPPP